MSKKILDSTGVTNLVNSIASKIASKYATKDSIPTTLPANGGNADTVDGVHISCINDATSEANWFAAFTNSSNLHAIDSSRAYVGNAGNSNTLGGIVDAYHLGTLSAAGDGHGNSWQLLCQHNIYGDDRFGIKVGDGSLGVRVDFATTAQLAYNSSFSSTSTYSSHAKNIDGTMLIGTSTNCVYSTILDWANKQAENKITVAYACIIASDGYPSDAPYQNEAFLQVESDYYNARQIVRWTRYLAGQPQLILYRSIFNRAWGDDSWRSVN